MNSQELHEALVWFYLSTTRSAIFAGGNLCLPMMKLTNATERDCLYQMFRELTNSPCKDILAMYEHIYSTEMSAQVPPERDPRIPEETKAYNVSATLNRFSEHDLQNSLLPKYQKLMDENQIGEQTRLARDALDLAKRVLGDGKRLPLAVLENLIPNHWAGRDARHVTIAISGF